MRSRLLLFFFATTTALGAEPHDFLRGIGWSPWHAVHGWRRLPEVVAQDCAILRDLHVNALRTWGPTSRKGCDAHHKQGLRVVPQLRRVRTARMRFKDGKEGHSAYVAPDALSGIREYAGQLAAGLKGHPAVAAYNLGNEYSWVGRNNAGHYQHQGFDDVTLNAFRATLRRRFGTIERWNMVARPRSEKAGCGSRRLGYRHRRS